MFQCSHLCFVASKRSNILILLSTLSLLDVYNDWSGLLEWTTGVDYWSGLLDYSWTTELDYWTGLMDWTTGLDYWTGLLDWTTELDY